MHCASAPAGRAPLPPVLPVPPARVQLHDSGEEHLHEMSVDARGVISELVWRIDNVELTTVGIDIGSSTSHLMFARVRLQRKTQHLSSQFVVIGREVLWRSPILLTPFLDDQTIDAAALAGFIEGCYRDAGLARADIDSGAVILTGEAIKKRNARALAEIFAADSGKFVCASAGHHLECMLAANGSGAVALSRQQSSSVLNVDVGGGTTKLARIEDGQVVDTCAIGIGGRLLAFDPDGRIARLDESARRAAGALGIELTLGEAPAAEDLDALVATLADALVRAIAGEALGPLATALLLTEPLRPAAPPRWVTFSGGVAEYLYGREDREFGDIARPLADRVLAALASGRVSAPVRDPGQGIRATVIGAAQFSVQVSGKTIHLAAATPLPVHDIPVLAPQLALGNKVDPSAVAHAIDEALAGVDVGPEERIALAVRWQGDPHYARLHDLAKGIAQALATEPSAAPLVVILDGDVGRSLGRILEDELRVPRPVVVLDGIALREFDYVDIGAPIHPANVVPVVIKSLLFAAGQQYLRQRRATPSIPSNPPHRKTR